MIDLKQARSMRADGASLFEIAIEFNVSRQAVWQRVKDVPCPITHVGGPKRKADPAAILKLRDAGLTYAQIAERLGLSMATVFKYAAPARRGSVSPAMQLNRESEHPARQGQSTVRRLRRPGPGDVCGI
jgi:DNA invertase Pin-like site-specific DNA recombinase